MNSLLKILVLPLAYSILTVPQLWGQEGLNEMPIGTSRSDEPSGPIIVILKGITRYDEAKCKTQDYLRKEYEDYVIQGFSYHLPEGDNDIYTESFYLENDEGHEVIVSFDMTDVYKARTKKFNKEFNKQLKEKGDERKKADKENEKRLSLLRKKLDQNRPGFEKMMAEEFKKLGKPAKELTKEEWEKLSELINKFFKEKLEETTQDKK